MTARAASRLAWLLWALAVTFASTHLALVSLNGVEATVGVLVDDLPVVVLSGAMDLLITLGGATLGALIASRRPRNPVGWLLLSAILGGITASLADDYAVHSLITAPGSLPSPGWAVQASNLGFVVWVSSIFLVFWFFPTGRLLSPRWRPLLGATIGSCALWALTLLLIPGPIPYSELEGRPLVENPIRIHGLEGLSGRAEPIIVAAVGVALVLTLAALTSRFRRSRGEERAQVKWLVYAGAITAVAVIGTAALGGIAWLISIAAIQLAMPVAAAIAIFKYRLYDIDRIINRTLVYGSLTVLLGGLYVGIAVGIGALVGDSGLLVAASTLLVAALFRPVRSGVQDLIDRRFYRKKYDAARALQDFSATLRDEVDLDALNRELVAVVEETMQPVHVSVWLRSPEAGG